MRKRGQVVMVKVAIGIIVGLIIVIGASLLLYGAINFFAGKNLPREEKAATANFGTLIANINSLLANSDLFLTSSFDYNLPDGYSITSWSYSYQQNEPGCDKISCICLKKDGQIVQCFPFDEKIRFLSEKDFSTGIEIDSVVIQDMWQNAGNVDLSLDSNQPSEFGVKVIYLEKYVPFTNQEINYIYLMDNLKAETRKTSGMKLHGGTRSFDEYSSIIKNQKDSDLVLYWFWSVNKFYPDKQLDDDVIKKMINITDELIFSSLSLKDYQSDTLETFFGTVERFKTFSPEIKGRTLISKSNYFFLQGDEVKAFEILITVRKDYGDVTFENLLIDEEALIRIINYLLISKNFDESLKFAEEYLQKYPSGKYLNKVHCNLNKIYIEKKDQEKAKEYLDQIPKEELSKVGC